MARHSLGRPAMEIQPCPQSDPRPERIDAESPAGAGLSSKRLMGFEPTTFCMASRRSSQLSYSRAVRDFSRRALASGGAGGAGDELGLERDVDAAQGPRYRASLLGGVRVALELCLADVGHVALGGEL